MLIFLTSCFEKEEKLYLEPTAGDLELGIAEMTSSYTNQIYYNLAENTTVKTNIFANWDIGFACSDTSWNIVLNNAKNMLGGNSFLKEFSEVTDESNYELRFDRSDGNPDSLAFTGWYSTDGDSAVSNGYVFLVDRGWDENFNSLELKKIQIELPTQDSYLVRYADLNGDNEETVTIQKDSTLNYICFSFDTGIVDAEPPKEDWTLRFTFYRTWYQDNEGIFQPYTVTGALLNPHKVKAMKDTTMNFTDIDLAFAQNLPLSKNLDIIGFDWKLYDFEGNFYTVQDQWNYVIEDEEGYFYRLHFVDFYNDNGEKGYPTFQFSRL